MKPKLSIFQWLFMGYLICFITSISNAATVTVNKDNIRYTVDLETNEAEVYGPVSSSKVINNLVIPDFIEYEGAQIPVTTIRNSAFYSNTNLRGSLTIGNKVHTIGQHAFENCSGFTGSLIIGENVMTIGERAFFISRFSGSLRIPNKVQTIGDYAFYYCNGFTGSLTIGENVQSIGDDAFRNCKGFTGSLIIGDNIQTIGEEAFYYCEGFTGTLNIGKNVQSIGQYAFIGCAGFTGDLVINPKVSCNIGRNAFEGCKGFNGSLIIGENIKEIGESAFQACTGFQDDLIIGNLQNIDCLPVLDINENVFLSCSGFKGKLVFGYSVKSIRRSFGGTYNFKEIFSLSPTPPESRILDDFEGLYDINLYVPYKSINLYKTSGDWERFKYIYPIQIEATDITLNKTEISLFIGQEETLIATLTPEDATTEIVWSTENNDNVISVDQTGKVSALSVGIATVVAKAGEVSATCQVTVNPVLATNIIINGDGINTLKETETLQLTTSILPDNVTYDEVTWSSSDENKAVISQNGLVTALEAGQLEITAELKYQPEIKATYLLTIEPRILGDANDNGVVNVADVGTISDYIVNKQVFKFCFVNADVITDQRITTADVTATVDIIFNDGPSLMKPASARKITATNDNRLVVDDFNSNSASNIGIRLTNPSDFVGLQASVILPQGMVVRNVISGESSKNHILNYNITDYGTLDFILYSLTNDSFSNVGSLLEIEAVCENSSEDINVENILASDGFANEYTLTFTGGKNNGLETSLESIEQNDIFINVLPEGIMILNAKGEIVNIFNLTAEVISSKEIPSDKEFYPLASGIYIVNVKDVTTKVIVK